MCTQTRWNLPIALLYLFVFLGATDPQVKILEKLTQLEEALRNLSLKMEELEKRVSELEKARPQKAVEPKVPRRSERAREVDMGQGFYAFNVTMKGKLSDTVFTGEIENTTTKDYKFVLFNIEVYDGKGNMVGANASYIIDIPMGARKPFEVTIHGINIKDVARYTIKYIKGS